MKAQITPDHAWLHQLVGEWHSEMADEDGGPPFVGTETVRLLGEAWVLLEGRGQMPDGTPAQMQMTLGFDPVQGAFVGSWVGSMMNHLWVYRSGQLDARRRVLSLPSLGPSFEAPGTLVNYRDEIEIVSADERLLHGNLQGEDGQWTRFMTTRYTRRR
jgi:hypothetical protein